LRQDYTLLKMIAGLLPPSSGEIRVEGRAITKPHSGVGIVFQTAMLLPWRSVFPQRDDAGRSQEAAAAGLPGARARPC
jgi:ABC-type taurine transport system ATPase subunit